MGFFDTLKGLFDLDSFYNADSAETRPVPNDPYATNPTLEAAVPEAQSPQQTGAHAARDVSGEPGRLSESARPLSAIELEAMKNQGPTTPIPVVKNYTTPPVEEIAVKHGLPLLAEAVPHRSEGTRDGSRTLRNGGKPVYLVPAAREIVQMTQRERTGTDSGKNLSPRPGLLSAKANADIRQAMTDAEAAEKAAADARVTEIRTQRGNFGGPTLMEHLGQLRAQVPSARESKGEKPAPKSVPPSGRFGHEPGRTRGLLSQYGGRHQ